MSQCIHEKNSRPYPVFWRYVSVASFLLALCACGGNGEVQAPDTSVCVAGTSEVNALQASSLCGCSSCFCSSDGWVCTGSNCVDCDCTAIINCDLNCLDGFLANEQGCELCECAPPPEPCEEGDTQEVPDGCNLCTCDASGMWQCTNDVCAAECTVGETRPSSDNCNVCTCDTQGQWQCTNEICQGCIPGEVMPPPNDCCTCSASAEWECTETPCSQSCEAGDTKDKGDGCNSCNCNDNNEWICTEEVCPEGSDCPPPKPNNCEKKDFWGKNLVTGTCCAYDSACGIPDGLEKFGDLPSCLDAPWQGFDGIPSPSQVSDEGIPADASPPP